jgi:hypothetical protein
MVVSAFFTLGNTCRVAATATVLIGMGPAFSAKAEETLPNRVEAWYAARVGGPGQYMRNGCAPTSELAAWAGLPVERCAYSSEVIKHKPVSTVGYFLFPSATQLANWTVNACRDAGTLDMETCTGQLMMRVWTASNAQFPVAGYVVEPAMSKEWAHPNEPYCYLFRDGVTVTTKSWTDTQVQVNQHCGEEAANSEPVVTAKTFGRVASTTRGGYKAAGGGLPVGTNKAKSPEWSAAVGAEFRKAWTSDRNLLFLAVVKQGFDKCEGNAWKPGVVPGGCPK